MGGRPAILPLAVSVGLVVIIFSVGFTSSYFTATVSSNPTVFTAWTSDIWVTTTTAEFNAGVPMNVNTSNDEVKLNLTMTGSMPYIYGLSGGNSLNFNRYNFSSLLWEPRANTLAPISYGGALTYDYQGSDYLYALAGGGTNNFTRYSITGNSWAGRANTLVPISYGGALAYANGYVYALAGRGNANNYTRYDPVSNTWTGMANTLFPIDEGGSLAYAGGNFIYALAGGGTNNFTRYSISGNNWTGMANTPGNIGEGGAITWDGGNFLYAIGGGSGGGGRAYFRYDISANTWTTLLNTQNPTRAGGAITSDYGNFIYIYQGGGTKFWRYTISPTPTWTELTGNPQTVDWGGSLVYVPGAGASCYSSPGTIASIVFDTTTPASRWDVLMWNATVPAGTTITFEVRASDTLFDKTDAAPAWTSVGGISPVYPIVTYGTKGQYFQWRATLTSTICDYTPVLYDVTVYYTDP